MVTKEKLRAAFNMLAALADVIKEEGEIVSGHLYAAVMSVMSLHDYEQAIELLIRSGVVRRSGHLLIWNVQQQRAAA